jgi:hypothetical protein
MEDVASILALGTAALVSGAALRYARTTSKVRTALRAAYLDACLPLFTGTDIRVAPSGLPRLNGAYRGARFDVQAVSDTLTYRKLPALWLMVTVPAVTSLGAVTDLMLRSRGTETFSSFMSLPHQIDAPAGFPDDCAIRTDDPSSLTPVALIADVLRSLGTDNLKELILSPKGLRIVWLAEQADRARYLLFRDAEMALVPLARSTLLPILDALIGLRDALSEPALAIRSAGE